LTLTLCYREAHHTTSNPRSGQITFNFLSNNKLGIGANVFTAAVESFVQACCDAGLCPEESPSVPPPSPPPVPRL